MKPTRKPGTLVPSSRRELGNRISSLIALYGTKVEAANVAGVTVEQLGHYVAGRSKPPFEVLSRLAAHQDVSLTWLATGEGPMRIEPHLPAELPTDPKAIREMMDKLEARGFIRPAHAAAAGVAEAPAESFTPSTLPAGARPAALMGDRDLPVRGRAEGGPGGAVMLDSEAIDWTWRPPDLRGVRDAFAMFVTGGSMGEVLPEGTTVFVHPSQPPRPGDFVVVEKHNHEALIKRLVRRSQASVTLRQYDPAEDFDLARRDVLALYRVVGAAFP